MSAVTSPPRPRSTRSPAAHRRWLGCGGLVLAALLVVGCTGESSSAQQDASVPADLETIRERADRSRVKGDSAAPVQLFEIADFQCSYCAQYYRETYRAIDSLYVETGKVRYVFITYPNANHRRAWPAIEAAYCAGAAGKFWEMHDLLFERQKDWADAREPAALFTSYAEEIGIDGDTFAACVRQDRPAPLQVQDLEQISRAGISSTPFFIVNNEISLQGAVPLERFRTVLDSVLDAAGGGEGEAGGSPGGPEGGGG